MLVILVGQELLRGVLDGEGVLVGGAWMVVRVCHFEIPACFGVVLGVVESGVAALRCRLCDSVAVALG
ncbi:MAG: hypothetical protein QOE54_2605 [Streptosporangiaceae bacterium]|nr:hypothetical protein [Streptosporangiaceae bacterium]